jgi:hypothetical protein
MSRGVRPRGGGSAVARRGGHAAGAAWRQEQQRAALLSAFASLPPADAVPLVLVRAVERVQLLVRDSLGEQEGGPGTAEEPCDVRSGLSIGAAEEVGGAEVVSGGGLTAAGLQRLCDQAADALAAVARDAAGGTAASSGAGSASSGPVSTGRAWDGGAYVSALLHHLLLLSSEAMDTAAQRPDPGSAHDAVLAQAQRLTRDALALPARWRVPVAVYAGVARRLGWEAALADLLAAMPDVRAAARVAARCLDAEPSLAPGFATAVLRLGFEGGANAEAASVSAGSPLVEALTAPGSPFLASLAAAVGAAAEVAGEAETTAEAAREFVPCLLLLARGVEAALQPGAGAAAGAATGAPPAALAHTCEALQEGLCAWQAALEQLFAADSDPTNGPRGGAATPDAAYLHELRVLLLERLPSLLSAQAAQPQPQPGSDGAMAARLRLRSRLVLLLMSTGQPGTCVPPVVGPHAARGLCSPVGLLPDVSADDVWQRHALCSAPGSSPTGSPVQVPVWLHAAAAQPCQLTAARCGLLAMLGRGVGAAGPCGGARGGGAAAEERLAALAVALLTPGLPSWLRAPAKPQLRAAAGPVPYSPYRLAVALLELLAEGPFAGGGAAAPGARGWVAPPRVALRMAAECLACVGGPEQQAALLEVVGAGQGFGGCGGGARSRLGSCGVRTWGAHMCSPGRHARSPPSAAASRDSVRAQRVRRASRPEPCALRDCLMQAARRAAERHRALHGRLALPGGVQQPRVRPGRPAARARRHCAERRGGARAAGRGGAAAAAAGGAGARRHGAATAGGRAAARGPAGLGAAAAAAAGAHCDCAR